MEAVMNHQNIRSQRLGIRASAAQVALLKKAAEATHKTLSEFILDTACRDAQKTLLDQRLFVVDENTGKRFLELLDEPAEASSGLEKLRDVHAPWD
ncbi:MAG: DUF1778 domain-containing protein [Mailhella sp.]|nr:DUF1778 domain-containing protein [Mailhella sp.]